MLQVTLGRTDHLNVAAIRSSRQTRTRRTKSSICQAAGVPALPNPLVMQTLKSAEGHSRDDQVNPVSHIYASAYLHAV